MCKLRACWVYLNKEMGRILLWSEASKLGRSALSKHAPLIRTFTRLFSTLVCQNTALVTPKISADFNQRWNNLAGASSRSVRGCISVNAPQPSKVAPSPLVFFLRAEPIGARHRACNLISWSCQGSCCFGRSPLDGAVKIKMQHGDNAAATLPTCFTRILAAPSDGESPN